MSEEELKEREVETPGENGDGAAVPSEGEPPETTLREAASLAGTMKLGKLICGVNDQLRCPPLNRSDRSTSKAARPTTACTCEALVAFR